MLRRVLAWLAAAVLLAAVAGYAVINLSGDNPLRWHVDPATVTRPGTPNTYLAAPPGTTRATPDIPVKVFPVEPLTLLARFNKIVLAQPRIRIIAGDVDSLMITYVQRTRWIGFPDYITVKAISMNEPGEDAASSLIIYSRSRYGSYDFGVNRARVQHWLAKLYAAG